MNIKQQLEQVVVEIRKDIEQANSLGWYSVDEEVLNKRIDSLSAIVEQMEADEQAIVEEVNKRWPTGKPQPDDTFVGAAPQVPDGMVLVPIDPTPNMVDAGVLDLYGTRTFMVTSGDVEREQVTCCYEAMIAAAKEEG